MSTTIPSIDSTPEPAPRRPRKLATAILVAAALAGVTALAAYLPLLAGGLLLAYVALDVARYLVRNRRCTPSPYGGMP